MPHSGLFRGPHIYDFTEAQQKRLTAEYENLPDDLALDEVFLQTFKQKFMPLVPTLRPEKMSYDERPAGSNPNKHLLRNPIGYQPPPRLKVDILVYVPFEGDASVFNITPSASNHTVVTGEVIGSDLVFTLYSPPATLDVNEHVKREIAQVEWRLNSLRGSQLHLDEQLSVALAWCKQARRREVEAGQTAVKPINIARRQQAVAPQPVFNPQGLVEAEIEAQKEIRRRASVPSPLTEDHWDVFVSHASEDKLFVESLVVALEAAGISVWFDRNVLKWGGDIRRGIDRGLLNCEFGIVVLSKAFLAGKKWTEHELSGLFARERLDVTVILPIWHGIDSDDLLKYSPALAYRLAEISTVGDNQHIVDRLLETLGRAPAIKSQTPVLRKVYEPEPPTAQRASGTIAFDGPPGNVVAHCRYKLEGLKPDSISIHIRLGQPGTDNFAYDSSRGEKIYGTRDEIAAKYAEAQRNLLSSGYQRMDVAVSGKYPEFK